MVFPHIRRLCCACRLSADQKHCEGDGLKGFLCDRWEVGCHICMLAFRLYLGKWIVVLDGIFVLDWIFVLDCMDPAALGTIHRLAEVRAGHPQGKRALSGSVE